MKTLKSRIAKLAISCLVLMANMSFTNRKTCPDFYIDNTAFPSCNIDIEVVIYDQTCTNVCSSPNPLPITVPAGGTLKLPCAGCTNICNIEITIVKIDNVAQVYGPVDMINNTTVNFMGSTSPCNMFSGITFSGSTFTFF